MIKIAPSILSADFGKLNQEIKIVEDGGADLLHIDIMDGMFVPNITFGPPVVKAIRKESKLTFDVHLMIEDPDRYVEDFVKAGADIITVHAEASKHLHRTVQHIKELGVKAGIALNPATSLSAIEYLIEELDMVLIMTVNPGFGGQSFIESMHSKIRALRDQSDRRGLNLDIEVDGGIKEDNIAGVRASGANIFVAGSAVFLSSNPGEMISRLKKAGN